MHEALSRESSSSTFANSLQWLVVVVSSSLFPPSAVAEKHESEEGFSTTPLSTPFLFILGFSWPPFLFYFEKVGGKESEGGAAANSDKKEEKEEGGKRWEKLVGNTRGDERAVGRGDIRTLL